jgi:IclR family pca regulon transcriptional regulator
VTDVAEDRKGSLRSLARGLSVLQAFSRERPAMTLSEVARVTGLTRATARRILLTLQGLSLVRADGARFSLTPRVLTLGWECVSSLGLAAVAQPLLADFVERTGESCAATTFDPPDIVCVAAASPRRVMAVVPRVGDRLPAHATCAGRVLLAGLGQHELERYLAATALEPCTPRTLTKAARLRAALDEVRRQGWAYVDQEFEIGVRSVAAPVTGSDGRTIAAVNTFATVSAVPADDFRRRMLEELLETARLISVRVRHPAAG